MPDTPPTSAATPPSEAPRRCAELVKCQVRGSTGLWMPCLLPAGHDGGCDPWVNYTTAPPVLLCEASALMAADTPTTSAAPASRCQECGCRIESCDNGLCDDCYVVSDPFRRRWGITVFWTTGAPFFSLGIHIDLHTPTVDLHVGSGCVQIGRNMWNGKRFVFATQGWSGHTDNCDHQRSEVAA